MFFHNECDSILESANNPYPPNPLTGGVYLKVIRRAAIFGGVLFQKLDSAEGELGVPKPRGSFNSIKLCGLNGAMRNQNGAVKVWFYDEAQERHNPRSNTLQNGVFRTVVRKGWGIGACRVSWKGCFGGGLTLAPGRPGFQKLHTKRT